MGKGSYTSLPGEQKFSLQIIPRRRAACGHRITSHGPRNGCAPQPCVNSACLRFASKSPSPPPCSSQHSYPYILLPYPLRPSHASVDAFFHASFAPLLSPGLVPSTACPCGISHLTFYTLIPPTISAIRCPCLHRTRALYSLRFALALLCLSFTLSNPLSRFFESLVFVMNASPL